MPQPNQNKKIVVLEPDHARRDYFRTTLSRWGHTPFCFEKETICIDNLPLLNADLAIVGPIHLEKIYRYVNSLKMIRYSLPLLIFSDNPAANDFIKVNGFPVVWAIGENAGHAEFKKSMNTALKKGGQREKLPDCPVLVGNDPEIVKIKKYIPELSLSDETIMIRGEPASGRELIAKLICLKSGRKEKPFIKINAAEISIDVLEGEFCGGRLSSVPGIGADGAGLFSAANFGTIFLDEIEALQADLQTRLLHIIEGNGCGQHKPGNDAHADVRIIAAAATDLESLVKKGKFRKDLYYRLNVLNLDIPPLRDRLDDIPLLADFFADKFCLRLGRGCVDISKKTKMILCNYQWPGNVGELEGMIRDMVVSGGDNKIVQTLGRYHSNDMSRGFSDFFHEFVCSEFPELQKYAAGSRKIDMKDIGRIYKIKAEGELIEKALEFTNWNRKKTARMLSISYKSLLNKIKAYNLEKSAD